MASSPCAVRRKLTKVQRERYIKRLRRLFKYFGPARMFVDGCEVSIANVLAYETGEPFRPERLPKVYPFEWHGTVILY